MPLCSICGCATATIVLPDGDGACGGCFNELAADERDQDEAEVEPIDWDAFFDLTND
jgi:hypothetical protein